LTYVKDIDEKIEEYAKLFGYSTFEISGTQEIFENAIFPLRKKLRTPFLIKGLSMPVLSIIACEMLEDELVYVLSKEPEIKRLFVVENRNSFRFVKKLRSEKS
jgi:hypothetical protein